MHTNERMSLRISGRGIRIWLYLWIYTLIISGTLAAESEANPMKEKALRDDPISQDIFEEETMQFLFEDQLDQSTRDKRNQEDSVEFRRDGDGENYNGSYADGKTCSTGQEPFNQTEAYAARKEFPKILKKYNQSITDLYTEGKFKELKETLNNEYKDSCASKICSFDLISMSLICGVVPPSGPFIKWKSCIDGSQPMEEEQFEKTSTYKKKYGATPIDEVYISSEDIEKSNRVAMELYGPNCKSKKCYYHALRGNYICSSSSVKPFSFLILISVFTAYSTFHNFT